MQTRKRAKSAKFGRHTASPVKKEISEATVPDVTEAKSEPVQTVVKSEEAPSTTEQTSSSKPELSATPFLSDTQPSQNAAQSAPVSSAKNEPEFSLSPNSSPASQADTKEEKSQAEQSFLSPELSPTPPQSQTNEKESLEFAKPASHDQHSYPFSSHDMGFDEPHEKKSFLKVFLLIVLVAFLLGLAFFGGVYWASQGKMFNFKFTTFAPPTPTKAPATPTPTPTVAVVDLSAYTIEVLNGSGITGEAARAKASLIDAGFKVGSVGNADKQDYTKTIIFAKKGINADYLAKLKENLQKTYVLDATQSQLPPAASNEADVIITLGSDLVK